MDISIGVFTAAHSMENIKAATQRLDGGHKFTFLPYTSMHQFTALYKENVYQFDGLLFSGLFPYQHILSTLGVPQKPHGYLEVADRDYYRVLLQMLYKNPQLDIRRVWIDYPSTNMQIPWCELFGAEDAIPQMAYDPALGYNVYGNDTYSSVLDLYLRKWNEKKIDFIITRLTNLTQPLQDAGIPFALLLPSSATIADTIEKLVQEILSCRVVDTLSAIGILQPLEELTPEVTEQFKKVLFDFNQQHGMVFILRQNETAYELITSHRVLRDLTSSYNRSVVSDFLSDNLNVPFALGWGLGNDPFHAQQNADRALSESKRSKKHYAYIVTETDQLIGPLVSGKSVTLSTTPDENANGLSKKLGIAPSNMQKLISIYQGQHSPRLNRNDLALYLNVTLRTANRILTKLSEIGAAQVVATEQGTSAGRPMAVYELNLEKLTAGNS